MEIFEIVNKLYTTKSLEWIKDLENNEINPLLINRWLSMNTEILPQCKELEKYVFTLSPKHYLQFAWNIVPKYSKAPFRKYIKSVGDKEFEYDYLVVKIRKYLQMSDNDWNATKKYFIKDIEENKIEYFKMFAVDKNTWKKNGIDYELMKEPVAIKKWW